MTETTGTRPGYGRARPLWRFRFPLVLGLAVLTAVGCAPTNSPPSPSLSPTAAAIPSAAPAFSPAPRATVAPTAMPSSVAPTWTPLPLPLSTSTVPSGSLTPTQLFERLSRSVWVVIAVKPDNKTGNLGSAVAVEPHRLVTNCHVLRGTNHILIRKGKTNHLAKLVTADVASDRCVLGIDATTLTPVPGVRAFGSLKVGETVYTIGNPRGLEQTLGQGLVSGLRHSKAVALVQTTAPISPGSSGGGLFDSDGNLVGVTTFFLRNAESLNFAIAAEEYGR